MLLSRVPALKWPLERYRRDPSRPSACATMVNWEFPKTRDCAPVLWKLPFGKAQDWVPVWRSKAAASCSRPL